jgi:hypothetical protein
LLATLVFFLRASRTLIEADCDIWVAENLAPDLAKQQGALIGKVLWTELQYVSFLSSSPPIHLS